MSSNLKSTISSRLLNYLTGVESLEDFSEWFAPIVWNIEDVDEPAAEELAYGIELYLAEYEHYHLSGEEFRQSLFSLLPQYSTPASGILSCLREFAETSAESTTWYPTVVFGLWS